MKIDLRLAEVKTPFEGKLTFSAMRAKDVSSYDSPWVTQGESEAQIGKRMEEWIKEVSQKYLGQTVVGVSHADPIWFLVAKIKNLPLTYRQLRTQLAYPELASVTQVVAEVGDVVKLSCD